MMSRDDLLSSYRDAPPTPLAICEGYRGRRPLSGFRPEGIFRSPPPGLHPGPDPTAPPLSSDNTPGTSVPTLPGGLKGGR